METLANVLLSWRLPLLIWRLVEFVVDLVCAHMHQGAVVVRVFRASCGVERDDVASAKGTEFLLCNTQAGYWADEKHALWGLLGFRVDRHFWRLVDLNKFSVDVHKLGLGERTRLEVLIVVKHAIGS